MRHLMHAVLLGSTLLGGAIALTLGLPARSGAEPRGRAHAGARDSTPRAPRSADLLALLPEGETKRKFIVDCTGCHQFDAQVAYPGGRTRTEEEWRTAVERMLRYGGARTPFPVISAERDPAATAAWLAQHLPPRPPGGSAPPAAPAVREYLLPNVRDLPHDLQVLADGRVLITGMMTDRMYTLDPASGKAEELPIPVQRANPRAVELAPNGDWWVLLGAAHKVARYRPATGEWRTFDIGLYAHSIGIDSTGGVWYNGHFTKDPEVLGRIDTTTGKVETFDVPRHPTMATVDGGPVPYELRIGPGGRVWMSELQGNRVVSFDPGTRQFTTHDMPATASGPRRFDVDQHGIVWIPAYGANALVRLDPATGAMRSFPLPARDAVPYVARVDSRAGLVWIGTSAADALFAFDPTREVFRTIDLPSRGAVVRHIAIDSKRGDVWLAYGASPGIPARVARVRVAEAVRTVRTRSVRGSSLDSSRRARPSPPCSTRSACVIARDASGLASCSWSGCTPVASMP